VIAAEGEQKASRALRDAADVIAESSSALQVRRQSSIVLQNTSLVDSVEMSTEFAYRLGRTLFLCTKVLERDLWQCSTRKTQAYLYWAKRVYNFSVHYAIF